MSSLSSLSSNLHLGHLGQVSNVLMMSYQSMWKQMPYISIIIYIYNYIYITIYLSILATQEWMCRFPWIGVWLGSKWQQPTRKDDQQIYQLHWPANSLRERLKKGHSWSSKGPEVDGSGWKWMELGDGTGRFWSDQKCDFDHRILIELLAQWTQL